MEQQIIWRFTKKLYQDEESKKIIENFLDYLRSCEVATVSQNINDEYAAHEEFIITLPDRAVANSILEQIESIELDLNVDYMLARFWMLWSVEVLDKEAIAFSKPLTYSK